MDGQEQVNHEPIHLAAAVAAELVVAGFTWKLVHSTVAVAVVVALELVDAFIEHDGRDVEGVPNLELAPTVRAGHVQKVVEDVHCGNLVRNETSNAMEAKHTESL